MAQVRVMVMDEAGVFYGKSIPMPNGNNINTGKLYLKGEIIMIEDHELEGNDYDKPHSGKGMTRYGSYKRVDDQALAQTIQPNVFTDPVKSAEAQARAIIENAKAEARRIEDDAKAKTLVGGKAGK